MTQDDNELLGENKGFDLILKKPIEQDTLQETLKRYLKRDSS